MDIILAAALAVCATTPENCVVETTSEVTQISVCGLAPEEDGRPIELSATLPKGEYTFLLEPSCNYF